eukprot:332944_1
MCSVKFVISITNPGDIIDIDLVYLQSIKSSARKDIVLMLQKEGLKVLRFGGSMVSKSNGYYWMEFRGDTDYRQPYNGGIDGYGYDPPGPFQTRGFGMFEVIDLCIQIECIPIITFKCIETPLNMSNFIEYCYGNKQTKYGNLRINYDNHPNIYNISWTEIGNEQKK